MVVVLFLLFRNIRDDCLGCQEHPCDRNRILHGRSRHFLRIDDSGANHIGEDILAGIESVVHVLIPADLFDDHGSLFPGIFGDLPYRIGKRPSDNMGSDRMVPVREVCFLQHERCLQKSDSSSRDDSFLDCGFGGVQGILDPELLLLHLDFGCGTDLYHGNSPSELRQPLKQLLLVVIRFRIVCLVPDLVHSPIDEILVTGSGNDGGIVLRGDHSFRASEMLERCVFELVSQFFGDDGRSGQDGEILEHLLLSVSESGRFDP